MNIYQESGYINIRAILNIGLPFNFIVGGRGTGKTYTTLETVITDDIPFMFMRRTQAQAEIINRPEFSPFKPLNKNNGWNIITQPITKYNSAFYNAVENEENKLIPQGLPKGYTCALSTIANVRGFDASDVRLLIYDEFIPERHERPLKNEGMAFLNAYETINRNRELTGDPPLQVLGLANANDLANPIFMELNVVRKAEQMQRKKQNVSIDRNRGIVIVLLSDSPISKMKQNTAVYRLTQNSDFASMALSNAFLGEESGVIKSRNLLEFKPLVTIGEITVYEHKSKSGYYVSTHRTGSPPTFGGGEVERARFQRLYSWIWFEYLANNVEFEEILCEILLTKYFK